MSVMSERDVERQERATRHARWITLAILTGLSIVLCVAVAGSVAHILQHVAACVAQV